MLALTCPCCGITAEETEFHPGGEAHLKRVGPEGADDEFEAYLFARKNPKGAHIERWRHSYGCGKWFHVARDTATLRVFGAYTTQSYGPPEDIVNAIRQSYPDWTFDRNAAE
ncbi:sarcosine oxidase subunit delta [Paracoccus sp. Z330]|uniref:Sarcosine oxidase subunit delta n=1 Tax=Paracoccus onchidii TaxID=3017813 RepID=A0ABT4ZBY4_9RHOB|nr:sarcosine oxidase subunit delta [Paracoccus onchidii]MDB6176453.1 sarcosine oxidase subunit delta [Paracoccus onchidii]